MNVATSQEMREIDRRTIEEFGVPSLILMENAATRVVETLAQRRPTLRGARVAIVCGKGNNGGDGLAIARHLAVRFHARVTVWMIAPDPGALSPDAAANLEMAEKFGLTIHWIADGVSVELGQSLASSDIVIDALLGTGFRGALEGGGASAVEAINAAGSAGAYVVAVDIPSGAEADTGNVNGPAVRAAITVTFALPKIGLLLFPAAELAGEVIVGEIGTPPALLEGVRARATSAADVAQWIPARINGRDSNKGKFGHVTVFAGSAGLIGAAALSAESAARMGSGLVTLAVPEGLLTAAMSVANPVVMTAGLPQTPKQTFSSRALDDALALAEKGTAAAIGPGLGGVKDEDLQKFVREFVARCPVPLVIDADALNVLSLEPDRGASLVRGRKAATVLTPHPGEMGRLLGIETAQVQERRLEHVRHAAETYGCAVLLKGSRTLIATPDGRLTINTTSNPGMATGGAGDVLTGVIATLLGQKLAAGDAAAAGAYAHGLAGDLAVLSLGGAAGLIAKDIVDYLPKAIGKCQLESDGIISGS
ncbi:bifunctional NAD(P)H-hydrate repair enzyme Nnr [Capsulimonas corticalis]|uniref:Bifunctional NAD(P)H-hydrate repair enzyme n=1 Tax=Capsulimonas corticalis TaxID=2219043 RepID=A0A402CTN4_9BACT|nr:NAD(P)H-hydrate dehydratase [Capsulimonas corticalis]BDI30671.1 bifunctional NAD(P)H-hydrate repair enzyme Nnr [Capsulimonas corticalis]